MLGLLLVPLFLHRSDRTLKTWIGLLLGVAALGNIALAAIGQLTPGGAGALALQQQAAAEPSYPVSVLLRLVLWAPTPVSSLVGLVLPAAFLIGILAARHRVLDEPGRHLPLLRRTAVLGLALGWGLGSVQALLHLGVLVVPDPSAFCPCTCSPGSSPASASPRCSAWSHTGPAAPPRLCPRPGGGAAAPTHLPTEDLTVPEALLRGPRRPHVRRPWPTGGRVLRPPVDPLRRRRLSCQVPAPLSRSQW